MIGGDDIVIENPGAPVAEVLHGLANLLREHWRHAVFENAETGERFEKFWEIPFGKLRELLVYRDEEAHESWERLGADPGNTNQMVHLLASEEAATIVIDDHSDPAVESLVAELADLVRYGLPGAMRAA